MKLFLCLFFFFLFKHNLKRKVDERMEINNKFKQTNVTNIVMLRSIETPRRELFTLVRVGHLPFETPVA